MLQKPFLLFIYSVAFAITTWFIECCGLLYQIYTSTGGERANAMSYNEVVVLICHMVFTVIVDYFIFGLVLNHTVNFFSNLCELDVFNGWNRTFC
jgi:hypothetical protein